MQTDSQTTLEVLIIGAGFSGICAGIKLKQAGISNFQIYDKASGIGGTWWHNTYPGAACDVASHLYCYSFEPNPNWSRAYSPQAEIQAYIESCANKYGLVSQINLGRQIKALRFDDDKQLWVCDFADGKQVQSRHVINAAGGLHKPAFPTIPGMDGFKGPTMHSADWDHGVDFTGKRVAMIGSAASAIQITPELAKTVQQLDIYQRTPNYILPRYDKAYSEPQKEKMSRWPMLSKLRRLYFFMRGELIMFPLVRTQQETKHQKRVQGWVNQYIDAVVQDSDVREKLRPNYQAGCKRILISDDFYQSLNRDNVALISDGIAEITADSVVTRDGQSHPADIIIYATGFDVDGHALSIDVIGPAGRCLKQQWDDIPQAYEGVMTTGMPNYYMLTGPNTGVGTTSVVFMVEQALDYVLRCIDKAGSKKLISVKPEAQAEYNSEIQTALSQTVWAGSCQSWYKRADGRISTLYPYNARSFKRRHKRPNMAHFVLADRKTS